MKHASSLRRLGGLLWGLLLPWATMGCGPQGPVQVPLHYGPTSTFSIKEGLSGPVVSSTFTIGTISDARPSPPGELGENREDDAPVKVYVEPTAVVETVESAVRSGLSNAGLRLAKDGGVRLDFEIVQLWVEERHLYEGVARLRVRVSGAEQPPTVVVIEGKAKRFGSSLSAENYNEVISDALLHAMENLVTSPAFSAALAPAAE